MDQTHPAVNQLPRLEFLGRLGICPNFENTNTYIFIDRYRLTYLHSNYLFLLLINVSDFLFFSLYWIDEKWCVYCIYLTENIKNAHSLKWCLLFNTSWKIAMSIWLVISKEARKMRERKYLDANHKFNLILNIFINRKERMFLVGDLNWLWYLPQTVDTRTCKSFCRNSFPSSLLQ